MSDDSAICDIRPAREVGMTADARAAITRRMERPEPRPMTWREGALYLLASFILAALVATCIWNAAHPVPPPVPAAPAVRLFAH